ncbi:MAG: SGNH/GDSL hydrolase family protein [Verrucomicrobiota bacterium]|jgi:hypothetical protein
MENYLRATIACILLAITLPAKAQTTVNIVWHDPSEWGVEGRGWEQEARKRWYDRLPAKAEGVVTDAVWNLSRHSAGMMVRFQTDASSIHAQWKLLSSNLAMPHMPASGVSGLDLYARDESGNWRWAAATRPNAQSMEVALLRNIKPGLREYALYLPLYNGCESLEIGIPEGASFKGLPPRQEKPIVFYGTSITHGACASRPGMAHPAILGRRFDRPVINLGFSGNGRMHKEVGDLIAELSAGVIIIDCLPNMNAASVAEKTIPLVNQLRAAQPNTPIILVEDRRFTNTWLQPEKEAFHDANHTALRQAYTELKTSGITNLFYIPGDDLLGHDAEGATDASHPNDLGFVRQADVFEPVLREALRRVDGSVEQTN